MAYVKTDWENLPSTDTPITDTALDNMENGIEYNDQRLNGTKPMGSIVVDDISGKNLLDVSKKFAGGYDGSGNWVNSSNYITVQYIPVKANTQYIMSSLSLDLTKYTALRVVYWNSSMGFISRSDAIDPSNNTFTFTTPNNTAFIALCFYTAQTASLSDLTQGQLEIGNTATTYTPYNQPVKQTNLGVKEDCTFYANNFKCRNLLPNNIKSQTINGVTITHNADGSITLNGTSETSFNTYFINYAHFILKPNTYVQKLNRIGTITGSPKILYFDQSNNQAYNIDIVTEDKKVLNVTAEKDIRAISIYLPNESSYSNVTIYPMLEVGSEPSPYTMYRNFDNTKYILYDNSTGSNGTIELGDTVANYEYLEIYYRQQDSTHSYTKVYNPNGKTVILMGYHVTNNGYAIGVSARNVYIGGTSISTASTNRNMYINILSSNSLTGGEVSDKIFITRVVGLNKTQTTAIGTRGIETSGEENR